MRNALLLAVPALAALLSTGCMTTAKVIAWPVVQTVELATDVTAFTAKQAVSLAAHTAGYTVRKGVDLAANVATRSLADPLVDDAMGQAPGISLPRRTAGAVRRMVE